MIVVDTSVWIAAFRDANGREAAVLRRLLDSDDVALANPVRLEILAGASSTDRRKLRRALSPLPLMYPTDDTWTMLDAWVETTAAAGQYFGFGDLLIGAMAVEMHALVWSLDRDFARLEQLGLLQRYEP